MRKGKSAEKRWRKATGPEMAASYRKGFVMAVSLKKKIRVAICIILLCLALPVTAFAMEKSSIDTSEADNGYIVVYHAFQSEADFRVGVSLNGTEQLHPYESGSRAKIALPGSRGEIIVTLYEQVEGNAYKRVEQQHINKTRLTDTAAVLMQSSVTEAPVLQPTTPQTSGGGIGGGTGGTGGGGAGGTGGGGTGGAVVDITDIVGEENISPGDSAGVSMENNAGDSAGASMGGGGGQAWTADRTVPDEFRKYLESVKEINWSQGDSVSRKASELIAGKNTTEAQVMAIYSYIVQNFSYNWDLYNAVKSGQVKTYTPNPNNVLSGRKGICYDIASLFAAMLRSVGIPAKMVKGNAVPANGYHAWNSVYDFESLSWVDLDATLNLGGKGSSIYQNLRSGYSPKSAV